MLEKILQGIQHNLSAPAFIYRGVVITHRQFFALLCAAARLLHGHGVKPGNVVGLSLDQSPLHLSIMLALARMGAISVPMHPALPHSARERIARKYGVSTVLAQHDEFRIDGLDFLKIDNFSTEGIERSLDFIDFRPEASTPFRIALSAGTSGDPKGVLFSHGHMLDRMQKTLFRYSDKTRLIPFDLHFTMGYVFSCETLAQGGAVVFPDTAEPADTMASIRLYAITDVIISPRLAMSMLPMLPGGGIAFPTLQHLFLVGDPRPPGLLGELQAKATPNIYKAYGLSETGGIALADLDMLRALPESSGRVQPWVQVEIVDEEGRPLPVDESGEIRIRADPMPAGYYLDQAQTAKSFRDGWFHTGDRGYLTADRQIIVEGRIDDALNIGGQIIDPYYIEDIVNRHPAVRESIAFALPVESGINQFALAVVPRIEGEEPDLAAYCAEHLGRVRPERYFYMREFPRTPGGKVLRAKIPATIVNSPAKGSSA